MGGVCCCLEKAVRARKEGVGKGPRERPPTRWRWKLSGEEVGHVGTKQFPGQETAEAQPRQWCLAVTCPVSSVTWSLLSYTHTSGRACCTLAWRHQGTNVMALEVQAMTSSLVGTSLELSRACQPTVGVRTKMLMLARRLRAKHHQ